jgi:tetratricopeptide (TPR) repeat protein
MRAALARGAVVTLVGPHGVGKSELALHLLATPHPFVGDEHVFVDLLAARDEEDVVATIAAALDVRACNEPVAAVREALIARGGLLVLDRCHHVSRIGDVVRALRVDGRPAIVCTSTGPLGVPDERAIVVDPLDPLNAIELFLLRSGQAIDSSRDTALVRELVALCGGVPLAIELCAASDESPLQILRELETRVPRDAELPEVVRWSIERLDRVSRSALSRASVIEGSFTLAAFEEIVDVPAAPAVLSALATRGLVARSPRGDARFVIVPIVRTLAEAELTDDDRRRTLQRHATYFAAHYASDVVTRSRERADLLVAHQFALVDPELGPTARALAIALSPVLRRHGPLSVARAVVEATLTIADDPLLRMERFALDPSIAREPAKEARVALLAGEAFLDRDEAASALSVFRDAARDPSFAMMALRGSSEALRRLGRLAEARENVERALSLACHRDQPTEIGDLLTLRGAIALEEGELRAARADLVEALTILGEGRDERAAAAATIALAEVQAEEGIDAMPTLSSAADLARRAGDLRAIARVEQLRAIQAIAEGQLDRARACLDAAERFERAPLLRDVLRARGDQRDVTSDSPLVRAHLDRARVRLALVRSEPIPAIADVAQNRVARRTLGPAKCAIARDGARALDLDLERRPTLKKIVATLLRARIEEPGRAVPGSELFAAGWPGERIPAAAQGDRVRAALQALRDLGMRGHIVTLPGGWALDPDRAYDVLPT